MLMHIGMDTVSLDGKGFEAHVEQGDKVVVGQQLISFDMDVIKKAGLVTETPVIITIKMISKQMLKGIFHVISDVVMFS